MTIIRKINNNVVLADDVQGGRRILTGRGIGFAAIPGQPVRADAIEHTFVLMEQDNLDILLPLLKEIPLELLYACEEITQMLQTELEQSFSPVLAITLADHIFMATKRAPMQHPWEWEIKQFYPKEYEASKRALAILNTHLKQSLPDTEATFLALHFVNAQADSTDNIAGEMTKSLIEIIQIINHHYQMDLSQEGIAFSRFVTHFRFYLMRLAQGKMDQSIDEEIVNVVQLSYPIEYACAEKIAFHINQNYHMESSQNELVYLTLHIRRILDERSEMEEKS